MICFNLGNMLLLLPSDNLPKLIGLLQDRKRTPSATFGGGNRITLSPEPEFPTSGSRKAVVGSSNRPDVVATCAAVASKLSSNVNGKTNDNVALPSWEIIKELSRYMSKLDYLEKNKPKMLYEGFEPGTFKTFNQRSATWSTTTSPNWALFIHVGPAFSLTLSCRPFISTDRDKILLVAVIVIQLIGSIFLFWSTFSFSEAKLYSL